MSQPEKTFELLCAHVRETALLESVDSLLNWDERTYLPSAAGAYRAEQITYLAGLTHARRTDPRLGEWLAELQDSPLATDKHGDVGTTIRQLQREYDKRVRIPQALAEALARESVLGQQAWVQARGEDNYERFAPHLKTLYGLKREQAAALGCADNPYDALLDDFEPGMTTGRLGEVFANLRRDLVPLVQRIAGASRRPPVDILSREFPVAQQETFGKEIAAQLGFDFSRGRLDVTHHPFCTSMGPHDCRITTRYDDHFFPTAFFGILHEAGHGMYDQGLRADWHGLPPGSYVSLGVHESQSRWWENLVGRSHAFWEFAYPKLRNAFPTVRDVSLADFHFAVNNVAPSLIRVEADEATYNLHIIIRFELEQAILSGDLPVADIPGAWREMYQSYLGVSSPTDADGCLQDVHWSAALIGYFPTYTLGNLLAAQFFAEADRAVGGANDLMRRGEFQPLLTWLRENIHRWGQCYSADELAERITRQPLGHAAFIKNLEDKLAPLYGL